VENRKGWAELQVIITFSDPLHPQDASHPSPPTSAAYCSNEAYLKLKDRLHNSEHNTRTCDLEQRDGHLIVMLDHNSAEQSIRKSIPRWLLALVFVGVWTLVGFTFSALSYASAVGENRALSISYALQLNLTRFYVWALLSLVIFRFVTRFPIQFRPFGYKNLLLNIAVAFFFAGLHQTAFLLVGWELDPTFKSRYTSFTHFYRTVFLAGLYLNILIALLIVITEHAFIFYRNYRDSEVHRSLLRTQLAQAELQALKMQLHPHFLFNALHSISALIFEDQNRANLMVSRLADFLRLTLDQSKPTVPLREELEFLRCYLEIEQVRFQDRLAVEFDIEPAALNLMVPHLILQPLVENAIRHVVAARSERTRIVVRATRRNEHLKLEIADNGPGIPNGANGNAGLGLRNVRARLEQTFGPKANVEILNGSAGGCAVILHIPVRG
jgi:signal transduction histidine kinase